MEGGMHMPLLTPPGIGGSMGLEWYTLLVHYALLIHNYQVVFHFVVEVFRAFSSGFVYSYLILFPVWLLYLLWVFRLSIF